MKQHFTLFAVMAMFAGSVLSAQTSTRGAAEQIERGRRLYMDTGCWQCHGIVGQGGRITGPALLPRLMPIEAFTAQMREPAEDMPPYTAKVMSDEDIKAIHVYLASLPASPDPATIPLLRDASKP